MTLDIKINAAKTQGGSSVAYNGSFSYPVSDNDLTTFGITDSILSETVKKIHPDLPPVVKAYVRKPDPVVNTSITDIFAQFGVTPATTDVKATNSTITVSNLELKQLAQKNFVNDSKLPIVCNADVTASVTDTAKDSWSEKNTLSLDQTITYEISFLGSGAGGETGFGFSHEWMKGGEVSESETLGTSSGVSFTLPPGDKAAATLSAYSAIAKVIITYEATLGSYFSYYCEPNSDGIITLGIIPMSYVFNELNMAPTKTFTETLDIGYYTSTTIQVTNSKNNVLVLDAPYKKISQLLKK